MPVEIHVDTAIITINSNSEKERKPQRLSKNGQEVLDEMLSRNPNAPGQGVKDGIIQSGEND